MTEGEWLTATDPTPMLEFIQGEVSDRKLKLFAVACCRSCIHVFEDLNNLIQQTIVVAERLADGEISQDQATDATRSVESGESEDFISHLSDEQSLLLGSVERLCRTGVWETAQDVVNALLWGSEQAVLFLRDIFGNPFHPIPLDPSWLTSTVLALAQQKYDSRDFSAMPILADALQDAGCENSDLLNHCREPGEHVRGCFAVDLLLGKK